MSVKRSEEAYWHLMNLEIQEAGQVPEPAYRESTPEEQAFLMQIAAVRSRRWKNQAEQRRRRPLPRFLRWVRSLAG